MLRAALRDCACPRCVVDEAFRVTHGRWIEMMSIFNERQTRLYAAEKALTMGHGGITRMAEIFGIVGANHSPRY